MVTHNRSNHGDVIIYIQDGSSRTSINTSVISAQRGQDICTGTNRATIVLVHDNVSDSIDIGTQIVIGEGAVVDGTFEGNYYLMPVAVKERGHDGTVTLTCQDITKLINDYLVEDEYTIDEPTTTRYWIEYLLDKAGIEYNITASGQGTILSNNTSFGREPLSDTLTFLVQHSGWYYVGESYDDGGEIRSRLKIGKLSVDTTYTDLPENMVEECNEVLTDKMSRNRLVVWGASNELTGNSVFADLSVSTGWQYDSNDIRSAALANSNIPDDVAAASVGARILNELQKLTYTKEVTITDVAIVDGDVVTFSLGDLVRIVDSREDYHHLVGIEGVITSMTMQVSSSGRKLTLVLDERCPRIIGYFDYGGYVYIGTVGAGVWRKYLRYDHTWMNYSEGLPENAVILDLHVAQGMLAARVMTMTDDTKMLYIRSSADAAWAKFTPPSLTGTFYGSERTFTPAELVPKCCSVDKYTGHIYAGFEYYEETEEGTIIPGSTVSFILDILPSKTLLKYSQVIDPWDADNYHIIDLDKGDADLIVSAAQATIEEHEIDPPETSFQKIFSHNNFNANILVGTQTDAILGRASKYDDVIGANFTFGNVPTGSTDLFCKASSGRYQYWASSYGGGSFDVKCLDITYGESDPRNNGDDISIPNGYFVAIADYGWCYYVTKSGTEATLHKIRVRTGETSQEIDNSTVDVGEDFSVVFGTRIKKGSQEVISALLHGTTSGKIYSYRYIIGLTLGSTGLIDTGWGYTSEPEQVENFVIDRDNGTIGWTIIHFEGYPDPYGYTIELDPYYNTVAVYNLKEGIDNYLLDTYGATASSYKVRRQAWPVDGVYANIFSANITSSSMVVTGFLINGVVRPDTTLVNTLDGETFYYQYYSVNGNGFGNVHFYDTGVKHPTFFGKNKIVLWTKDNYGTVTGMIEFPSMDRINPPTFPADIRVCTKLSESGSIIGADYAYFYKAGPGSDFEGWLHGETITGSVYIGHDMGLVELCGVGTSVPISFGHYIYIDHDCIDDPDWWWNYFTINYTNYIFKTSNFKDFAVGDIVEYPAKVEVSQGFPLGMYYNIDEVANRVAMSGFVNLDAGGPVIGTPDGTHNTFKEIYPGDPYTFGLDMRTMSTLIPTTNGNTEYGNWMMMNQYYYTDPDTQDSAIMLFNASALFDWYFADRVLLTGDPTQGTIMEGVFDNVIKNLDDDFPYAAYLVRDTGFITHIETSNYATYPYMFYCTSDTPSRFYQKDSNTTGLLDTDFTLRVDSIPDAYITIIRVDDRI